jgi:hypothetical protein
LHLILSGVEVKNGAESIQVLRYDLARISNLHAASSIKMELAAHLCRTHASTSHLKELSRRNLLKPKMLEPTINKFVTEKDQRARIQQENAVQMNC